MFAISIGLLCTRKPGTLSSLFRVINQAGLQYQSHTSDDDGQHTFISIEALGKDNSRFEDLRQNFARLPEVVEVRQLDIAGRGKPAGNLEDGN